MLWMRFREKSVYYVYVKKLLRLLVTSLAITVCRCNYNLKYELGSFFLLLKVVFNILYTKFCLDLFFYATSTFPFFKSNLKQVQIKIH